MFNVPLVKAAFCIICSLVRRSVQWKRNLENWFLPELLTAVAMIAKVLTIHFEGFLAGLLGLLNEVICPPLFEERYESTNNT